MWRIGRKKEFTIITRNVGWDILRMKELIPWSGLAESRERGTFISIQNRHSLQRCVKHSPDRFPESAIAFVLANLVFKVTLSTWRIWGHPYLWSPVSLVHISETYWCSYHNYILPNLTISNSDSISRKYVSPSSEYKIFFHLPKKSWIRTAFTFKLTEWASNMM